MDSWPFQPRSFAKLNVDDNKKWKTIFICEKTEREMGTSHLQNISSFPYQRANLLCQQPFINDQECHGKYVDLFGEKSFIFYFRIVKTFAD